MAVFRYAYHAAAAAAAGAPAAAAAPAANSLKPVLGTTASACCCCSVRCHRDCCVAYAAYISNEDFRFTCKGPELNAFVKSSQVGNSAAILQYMHSQGCALDKKGDKMTDYVKSVVAGIAGWAESSSTGSSQFHCDDAQKAMFAEWTGASRPAWVETTALEPLVLEGAGEWVDTATRAFSKLDHIDPDSEHALVQFFCGQLDLPLLLNDFFVTGYVVTLVLRLSLGVVVDWRVAVVRSNRDFKALECAVMVGPKPEGSATAAASSAAATAEATPAAEAAAAAEATPAAEAAAAAEATPAAAGAGKASSAAVESEAPQYHLHWQPDLMVFKLLSGCCLLVEEYKSAKHSENDRCVLSIVHCPLLSEMM